jgi:hypothetical protein
MKFDNENDFETVTDSDVNGGVMITKYLGTGNEVNIPTSINCPVIGIGEGAFNYCTGLTAINVASDNETYSSQDGVLYNKDKTELVRYPAGKKDISFTIPDSVKKIRFLAFAENSLTSITITDSIDVYQIFLSTALSSFDLRIFFESGVITNELWDDFRMFHDPYYHLLPNNNHCGECKKRWKDFILLSDIIRGAFTFEIAYFVTGKAAGTYTRLNAESWEWTKN